MFNETSWIKSVRAKFSPLLRKKVIEKYRFKIWIPCFLQKPLRFLARHFRKVSVVVELDRQHYYSALDSKSLSNALGISVKHTYKVINGFSSKVSIKNLEKLMTNGAVTKVWYDRPVETLLDVASPVVNAPQVWNQSDTVNSGEGVGIAILDTGIYPHPDLITPVNRIVAFKDFVKGRTNTYDDNGHGTHCAGDAASNGFKSGGLYSGPAPKANLIGVKVLNKLGSGLMSDIIAGIQWCIDNKDNYNIRVLSMSLGGKATSSYKDDPLCTAVEKAWDSGIAVCVAAGNEGPEEGTISSPGIDPQIITVGAMDDRNTVATPDDSIASFSSRGPTVDGLVKPDLVAPGVNVVSLRSPKSNLDKSNKKSRVGEWYTSLSGTSMATPVCAGVAALIIARYPDITPGELKERLVKTSRTLNKSANDQGAGLIDVMAAIQYKPESV